MTDKRWTIRSTGWQTEGVRSVGKPQRRRRDDIVVATRSSMEEERKGQGKMEDSGGGLLPVLEGHSPQ